MRALRWAVLVVGLAVSTAAAAPTPVAELTERLRRGEDFRERVQAALQLGKTKATEARLPLEAALRDPSPAVRAAAAAALRVLGDKRSIPALERQANDAQEAVRQQIRATLEALRRNQIKPQMVVEVGSIVIKDKRVATLKPYLERESRAGFGELPGVSVVEPGADGAQRAEQLQVPLVKVTGRLKDIKETRAAEGIILSASVELVVHRMPGHDLVGTVSGSASTTVTEGELRDRTRGQDLRRTVLAAAIAGAIKRAPRALLAAAR